MSGSEVFDERVRVIPEAVARERMAYLRKLRDQFRLREDEFQVLADYYGEGGRG